MLSTRNTPPASGFAAPQRTPQHAEAEFLDEIGNLLKALRMARRKDHHSLGIIGQDVAKRREQRAFFVLERAATHQNRAGSGAAEALAKTRNDRRRWRRRHIEFQVAGDRNLRFGRANFDEPPPVFFGLGQETNRRCRAFSPAISEARSGSACSRASERSEMRQLMTAMRAPLRLASRRKFGQNSVSATTTSSGCKASR